MNCVFLLQTMSYINSIVIYREEHSMLTVIQITTLVMLIISFLGMIAEKSQPLKSYMLYSTIAFAVVQIFYLFFK